MKKITILLTSVFVFCAAATVSYASEDDTITGYEIGGVEMSVEDGDKFITSLQNCHDEAEIRALCEQYGVSYDAITSDTGSVDSDNNVPEGKEYIEETTNTNVVVDDDMNQTIEETSALENNETSVENLDEQAADTAVERKTVDYEYNNKYIIYRICLIGCAVLAILSAIIYRVLKRKSK